MRRNLDILLERRGLYQEAVAQFRRAIALNRRDAQPSLDLSNRHAGETAGRSCGTIYEPGGREPAGESVCRPLSTSIRIFACWIRSSRLGGTLFRNP
jgi:hypothetical protein